VPMTSILAEQSADGYCGPCPLYLRITRRIGEGFNAAPPPHSTQIVGSPVWTGRRHTRHLVVRNSCHASAMASRARTENDPAMTHSVHGQSIIHHSVVPRSTPTSVANRTSPRNMAVVWVKPAVRSLAFLNMSFTCERLSCRPQCRESTGAATRKDSQPHASAFTEHLPGGGLPPYGQNRMTPGTK
jgi:hypothetical protein